MDATFFDRIRGSLSEKRQNLLGWLQATLPQKQQIRLGDADDCSVRAHLEVLDTALQETAEQSIGMCAICQDYVDPNLLEMDYTTHLCLEHLSGEEMDYLQSELDLAQQVHKSFMPQKAPDVPGLDFAAYSRPAQIIGGDLFDFFTFQGGAQGFAIADVAGHGVFAGLLMAGLQTALRTLVPLQQLSQQPARDLVRALRDELQQFTGGLPLADDTTIVVCRIDGKM